MGIRKNRRLGIAFASSPIRQDSARIGAEFPLEFVKTAPKIVEDRLFCNFPLEGSGCGEPFVDSLANVDFSQTRMSDSLLRHLRTFARGKPSRQSADDRHRLLAICGPKCRFANAAGERDRRQGFREAWETRVGAAGNGGGQDRSPGLVAFDSEKLSADQSAASQSLVSASTYRLASLVFTSIMARVEPIPGTNPPRYALGDIGLGLGTKVRGQEMVLSPETQARLGANLGFQERIVLSECYKRQAMARAVVRTDTHGRLRHACRDRSWRPASAGQDAVCGAARSAFRPNRHVELGASIWTKQQRPYAACTALEWLPPNKVDDCVLYVDPNQFTLGIPNDMAFAVKQPPQGQSRIPLTQDLAMQAGRPSYTAQAAKSLEMHAAKRIAADSRTSGPARFLNPCCRRFRQPLE